MKVQKRGLGAMTPIAGGAVGQVYRLHSFRLPGLAAPLAFKELLPTLTPAVRTEALRSMVSAVDMRDGLTASDRADLDECTTWPLAMVEDGGHLVGLLMALIPPDFFADTNPTQGPPSQKVRALAWLSASEALLKAVGIDVSQGDDPLVRVALLAQLAYGIGLLHKLGVVYGDLSLNNVAFAFNPPRVLLLDCDATASASDSSRKQMHSPFFCPPEIENGSQVLQDEKTDVYKLALCILRGVVRGRGVTQLKDPKKLVGTLPTTGISLLTEALSPDRANRPTAKTLFSFLEQNVLVSAQPPQIHHAGLSRTHMVRGQDVTVSWTVNGASTVRIELANGVETLVRDPDQHPRGYTVTPLASGDVIVHAENRHGSVSLQAGTIDLFDLPQFRIADFALPRTNVPALMPLQIPSVLSALPARPMVSTASHNVPRLEAPSLIPALNAIRPSRLLDAPFVNLAEATSGATGRLMSAFDGMGTQATSGIREALMVATRGAATAIDDLMVPFRTELAKQVSAAASASASKASHP